MLLRECLEEIEDFRVRRCRKFELADIFLLVLLGILNGYKTSQTGEKIFYMRLP